MKILVILALCLIAEIRSYTYETRRPQRFLDYFGYTNTTDEEIDQFNRVLCEKNGNSQAYDDYVRKMRNYPICMDAVEAEIREEMSEGRFPYDPVLNARKVCAKRSKYLNCLKSLTDSAKTCIAASEHETFDQLYNAIPSITQFLCEDDGLRLTTFVSSNGSECMRSKNSGFMNCAENTLLSYVRETVSDGAEIGGIGFFHLLVPDATKCTIFNDFQTCTVNLFKDCRNQTAVADIATSILEIVNQATTCDRLQLVTSTTASTDDVDDV